MEENSTAVAGVTVQIVVGKTQKAEVLANPSDAP